MRRRECIRLLTAAGLLGPSALARAAGSAAAGAAAISVEALPKIKGPVTLYLGRGEGGLYGDILDAIRERNPEMRLNVRRGPSSALANTLVAEAGAGVSRADVFWAVDSGAIGRVVNDADVRPIPDSLRRQLKPAFRFPDWVPVSGRIRTLPHNTDRLGADDVPDSIMALPESGLRVGWAPAYGAFQSFVTALRLLEGEDAAREWLRAVAPNARTYAGEFGVVMAVARGEVDVGLANHYYTLRLKKGRPDASVALAFTRGDAGCLLNASGAVRLNERPEALLFLKHLLTREVQSYLAGQAFEIPLAAGVPSPGGLPSLETLQPPDVDLEALADPRPTLELLRETGVL